jgi:hypothetical protein
MGGGGGAPVLGAGGGDEGPLAGAGEVGVEPAPAEDRSFGGPIVPKRIDARWRAPPAPGPSSSEESSSLSESTTDQSSSSGRAREGRGPDGAAVTAEVGFAGSWVAGRRWKGLCD